MMPLRVDLEKRLERAIAEERKMAYVTSAERIGDVRGRAKGLRSMFPEVCGDLPEAYQDRIRNITSDELDGPGKTRPRFRSPADVERWLEQHAAGVAEDAAPAQILTSP